MKGSTTEEKIEKLTGLVHSVVNKVNQLGSSRPTKTSIDHSPGPAQGTPQNQKDEAAGQRIYALANDKHGHRTLRTAVQPLRSHTEDAQESAFGVMACSEEADGTGTSGLRWTHRGTVHPHLRGRILHISGCGHHADDFRRAHCGVVQRNLCKIRISGHHGHGPRSTIHGTMLQGVL